MKHNHHTKTKGDSGLGFVMADLMTKGIPVALPVSEHLPFDLVAIGPTYDLYKVSVKYRKKKKGVVAVEMTSHWSRAKGYGYRGIEKDEVDIIAIYCPDENTCYYVDFEEIDVTTFSLRIDPPSKFAAKSIEYRQAEEYTDPLKVINWPISIAANAPGCQPGDRGCESRIGRYSRSPGRVPWSRVSCIRPPDYESEQGNGSERSFCVGPYNGPICLISIRGRCAGLKSRRFAVRFRGEAL